MMMIAKTWLVGLSMVVSVSASAAVPPGMQDVELKNTLIYLAQEKQLVRAENVLLIEAGASSLIGAAALGLVPGLLLMRPMREDLVRMNIGLTTPRLAAAGAFGIALGAALKAYAKSGRATFDRDWNIERQHFRDLKRYFGSPLEVQYVIASDDSDLREYLMDLAAWIKASKANQETVTPSLKYQQLVPVPR